MILPGIIFAHSSLGGDAGGWMIAYPQGIASSRCESISGVPALCEGLHFLHYLHRFLMVPKGTFTVKTAWLLRCNP